MAVVVVVLVDINLAGYYSSVVSKIMGGDLLIKR